MTTNLSEFIQGKISDVEKSITSREETEEAWRSGADKSWAAVGCKLSKDRRVSIADREAIILVKLRHELEMFKRILEIVK